MKEDKSNLTNLEDENPELTALIVEGRGGIKAVRQRPQQKYPRTSERQQAILRRNK
ncbi:MAG: hypothetical protein ACW99J_20520 [Candidatus Thorarchaeota archaeon]|jgi:hypothetical protein